MIFEFGPLCGRIFQSVKRMPRAQRLEGATASAEWFFPRPAGDASARLRTGACDRAVSGHDVGSPVEQFTGFQHRLHDDGQLACNGDGGALEADLLS